MAIASMDMRHGMQVTTSADNGLWTVLDRHPQAGTWWLHRWTDAGKWETDYAHERDMSAADADSLSAPLAESDKWTKAAFNISDADSAPKRKTGYVLGKWGAHKREGQRWQAWTITHLPSGFAVKNVDNLQETRATLELLAAQDFPQLHASQFGIKPEAGPEIDRLKSLLYASS